MDKFPCEALSTIDQLWLKYSHGRFGFSVQQRIWQSVGGNKHEDYETSCCFAEQVGWRVNGNWVLWQELNFSSLAPVGHLPALAVDGGEGFGGEPGEESLFARVESCELHEPVEVLANVQPETLIDDLSSKRGVEYPRLQELLVAGQWAEADRETAAVILKAVGREQEGRIRVEDLEKFPCQDLCTIDQLWSRYSNGRFGLSVQRRIYENLGGTQNYDEEIWRSFSDRIGWRVNADWVAHNNLTFALNAPEGHLPGLLVWRWFVWNSGQGFSSLVTRLAECSIG